MTHILAAGGGGFSMSPNGAPTAFDRYILELSGKSSPLVAFVPTASADDPSYVNRFLVAYGTLGVRPMVLTLWQGARASLERLRDADIVVVGGGSTVNLMALWQAHGVDEVLRTFARTPGKVIGGVSAGASCWFSGCITDSFGGSDPWLGGLGIVDASFCPHYDGEADRAPAFIDAIAAGDLPTGYGVDDGAAVHIEDGRVTGYLAERPGARVYRVAQSTEPSSSGVLVEPEQMEQL